MGARALRIVQVLRAPIGGLFRHVADLSQGLVERGHEIGVVVDSLTGDVQTESKLERLRQIARLGVHTLPMPRVLGPGDLTTPPALRELGMRLRADVLHGHGAKGGFYARLARRPGTVSLYTPHGGVLHFGPRSPAGVLFGFLEKRLMSRTDAMVFESAFAAGAFARQIAPPACRTEVIHNGLAAAEFVPVIPEPDAADFAFVGELRTLKGIFVLIDAVAALKAAGRPVRLAMAGDGPDRAELEAMIAAKGLTAEVALLGVRPAREVFALGRCVIVPSLAESLPYVVLEAAAAARPVIATRVGGIAEIFGPTAAELVAAGDAAALAAAMRDALDSPGDVQKGVALRFKHIEEGFSLTRMVGRIEGLYEDLLGTG